MWRSVLEELRRAGPRRIAIIAILGAVAVVFAWGNHTSDSAASGATLPRTSLVSRPPHTTPAPRVALGSASHVQAGVLRRYMP
jgi:hypothetical protein